MRNCKIIFLVFALAFSFAATSAAAQTKTKRKSKPRLPRVGVIKDYEATGMQTGCGNLYFSIPRKTESLGVEYVYLARSGGRGGWFNLDGRDTPLRLLKTEIIMRGDEEEAERRYFYRAGATRITVAIRENEIKKGDDDLFSAVITLRRGRLARRIEIVGSSDC